MHESLPAGVFHVPRLPTSGQPATRTRAGAVRCGRVYPASSCSSARRAEWPAARLRLCVLLVAFPLLLVPRCVGLPAVPSEHSVRPHRALRCAARSCRGPTAQAVGVEQTGSLALGILRGGMDGGLDDPEGQAPGVLSTISTMALPGLGASHAFAPLEYVERSKRSWKRRLQALWKAWHASQLVEADAGAGLGRVAEATVLRHSNTSTEIVDDRANYAWFYPDPPWGRKDVFRPGSSFLRLWDCVLGMAMLYVAFEVPFAAAGFVPSKDDELHEHLHNMGLFSILGALWRHEGLLDIFVDCIFFAAKNLERRLTSTFLSCKVTVILTFQNFYPGYSRVAPHRHLPQCPQWTPCPRRARA